MNNYLVIGGSSGIGLSLSEILAKQGHKVHIASRQAPPIDIPRCIHQVYDALTGCLYLEVEHLEGLAYCPGTINLKPFHRLTPEDFRNDFDLNVIGAVRVIQQALPLLKKAKRASIVLFSTVAVHQGLLFHALVASAKAALEGLGRSLAAELAPKIRVNVIAPSITDTPLAEKLFNTPEKRDASASRHPLSRIGKAEDQGAAAAFLLNRGSSWITGQTLNVDGGMSKIRSL
ncbi:MAG: SDR family NAD(P)-dependent oxidoreductase [Cyclobacteriaceae bacterium]